MCCGCGAEDLRGSSCVTVVSMNLINISFGRVNCFDRAMIIFRPSGPLLLLEIEMIEGIL